MSEHARHFLSPELIQEYGVFDPKSVARFIRKFENGTPEVIGYRDNMLFTFLLSSQMANYWTRNPKQPVLDYGLKKVEIHDF